jgi:ArsR family transcriptional regulator, arsenate/arsenite/antimonite-responsive transcriptional repressor
MNNKPHKQMIELVALFKALGDPTRMRLIRMLASGMATKVSVIELAQKLGISQPAVSQHLKILKNVGIVEPQREGYYVYYLINTDTLKHYKEMIDNMFEMVFTKCAFFPNCEVQDE